MDAMCSVWKCCRCERDKNKYFDDRECSCECGHRVCDACVKSEADAPMMELEQVRSEGDDGAEAGDGDEEGKEVEVKVEEKKNKGEQKEEQDREEEAEEPADDPARVQDEQAWMYEYGGGPEERSDDDEDEIEEDEDSEEEEIEETDGFRRGMFF
ncbi:hypothetical protein LTR16_000314 [Cryomyces antarcticus]|uniref:RING-type domain-containing protein n=1 Tax=Cryomyces antarcticus TaxID=329879 RepID=A0ABR0KUP8_9PEZI|nr:hypothetical protein LTR39_000169 [Cryomyces antarcticus]KAK5131879.1 hypothetical protein LTR16_000314 [Cryomyces antarcticus]